MNIKFENKLRGFIVQYKQNQNDDSLNIAPILAQNESQAWEVIEKQNKIPISIVSFELLEFQINLLKNLAQSKKIELIKEQKIIPNTQKN